MTKHPYPEHIIEAVASSIQHEVYRRLNGSYGDFGGLSDEDAKESAELALQAMWDASRVDDIEQLENVPDFASLVDGEGFTYRAYELRNPKVFPVNIIHWGDSGA